MKLVLVLLLAVAGVALAGPIFSRAANATNVTPYIPAPPPQGATFVSPNGDFTITWQLDLTAQTIHILMSSPTIGWISMGWSNQPTMRGADYYTGSVDDKTGNVTLIDTWSAGDIIPALDTSLGGTNDITAITGYSQTGGVTTISFKRKINTGDKYDFAVVNNKVYLMWAWAPTDIRADGTYDIHTTYGTATANLYTGGVAASFITPGILLGFVVGSMAVVYVIFRVLKKCHQYRRRKFLKNQKIDIIAESPDIPLKKVNPQPSYYQGSQRMAYYEDKPEPTIQVSSSGKPEGYEVQKPKGIAIKNQIWGLLEKRVGYFDTPAMSIAAAVLWVAMNAACLWIMDPTLFSKGVGDLASMNALLLMIPATRNSALVWATGIPFDHAIQYHRWLGYWTIILTGIHMIYSFVIWYTGGADVAAQFSTKTNIYGLASFFCSVVMLVSSLEFVRRKFFEVFYYPHFLFIPFFIFGYFHSPYFAWYAFASGGLYVIDRIIRMIWGIVPMRTVGLVVKGKSAKDKLIAVRFSKNWIARRTHAYKTGQYVFANFPQISLLEWHPFSVSAGPHEVTSEIHIKGLGKYTQKLIEFAENRPNMWIRVDGPYGNLNMNWRRYPILVLVSGGIGITPGLGLIRAVFRTGEIDPIAKKKAHCIEKIYFMWTVQNKEQYSWFSKELSECYANSNNKGTGTPKLDLMVYVTRDKGATQEEGFIRGRPNISETIEKIGDTYPEKAAAVFVCGPKTMVDSAWDGSVALKKKGRKCHFHHETFEF